MSMISYNDFHSWVNAVLRAKFMELPPRIVNRNVDVVTDIKVDQAIKGIVDRIVENTSHYHPKHEFRVDPNNNQKVVPHISTIETGRMFNSLKKSFRTEYSKMLKK